MATPTYAQVLTQINTYIVANGNNEITGPVLNAVLKFVIDFTNNNIGDLNTLTTDQKNSVVEAINSLKQNFDDLVNNGVQLYTGIDDPNTTPPPTYNYADFYMQLDIDSLPVKLWQWNGFVWTDASEEPATESDNVQNNSSVPGANVTEALDNLQVSAGIPLAIEKIATAGQTVFNIGTTLPVKLVFWNGSPQQKIYWTQAGSNVTFTFPAVLNDLYQFI